MVGGMVLYADGYGLAEFALGSSRQGASTRVGHPAHCRGDDSPGMALAADCSPPRVQS